MATINERIRKEIGVIGHKWTILEIFELLKIDDPDINLHSVRTTIRRNYIEHGIAKRIGGKGKSAIYETVSSPTIPAKNVNRIKSRTPYDRSGIAVIEVVLEALTEIKLTGLEEITTGTLIEKVQETYEHIKPNSIYPLFSVELIKRKVVARTGATIANSRVYKIVPPAEKIREIYYADQKTKKPEQERQPDNDDEIDAVIFGDKVFRYWNILKNRLNTAEARLKDESEKQGRIIRGLQDEIKRLRKENVELEQRSIGKIGRGKYQELLNEKQRLERLVDEQNARIKAMSGKQGSKFKLGELAGMTDGN